MYRIGELAKRNGLKTDTLRFYDKQNLLTPSSRSESGYRLYTETDEEHLRFILRAKRIGFSLTDIAELLSIERNRENLTCADVKVVVDVKLADIEAKIAELNYFRDSLQRLSDDCCGGLESAAHCSILDTLDSKTSSIEYDVRLQQANNNHKKR